MLFYLEYITATCPFRQSLEGKKEKYTNITLVDKYNIAKVNVEQHSITVTHIYGKGNILTPNYILRYELPTRI